MSAARNAGSILGQGFAFPPRVDAGGRMVLVSGEDNVRESLAILLQTEPGERVQLPAYGAGLGRFVFEPNTPATHARIAHAITTSIGASEPRVRVESVEVTASSDPAEPQSAIATITYRLTATGAAERLALSVPLTGAGGR
jgi:phage baseplate assembly protein W